MPPRARRLAEQLTCAIQDVESRARFKQRDVSGSRERAPGDQREWSVRNDQREFGAREAGRERVPKTLPKRAPGGPLQTVRSLSSGECGSPSFQLTLDLDRGPERDEARRHTAR